MHDALYYTEVITSIYLMPLGLFVAAFSQAYVLASKTSTAYQHVENLSEELSIHANKLEATVEKRTRKIKKQRNLLEKKARELDASNQTLIKLAQRIRI